MAVESSQLNFSPGIALTEGNLRIPFCWEQPASVDIDVKGQAPMAQRSHQHLNLQGWLTPLSQLYHSLLSLHNSVFLKLHRGCSQLHSLKNLLYTCVGNPSCTEGSPLLWKVKTSDAFLSLWVWRWSAKGNIKNMPSILILMEMQNTLLRSIIYYIECRVLAFSM